MKTVKTILLSFLFILSFIGRANADQTKDLDAKEIIQKVQEKYASIGDYSASFVQTTAHKMFPGRLQRAYGKVMFQKGGRMRWEYKRPQNKLFIYDSKTLWIYEPEVPQIFAGSADAERLKKGLAFLTGQGRILNEYKVRKVKAEKFGFTQGYVLILKPKDKNSPFKYVELYVEKETFRVARSVVVDHENNRNRLDFTDPKFDQNFPEGYFIFTPPKGVPVTRAE